MTKKILFSRIYLCFERSIYFLILLVIVVGVSQACGGPVPSGEDATNFSEGSSKVPLEALARRYELRNTAGFVDLVHNQYEDTEGNRNDLRYRISRVVDQYGNIEVQLHEIRILRDSPRVLEVPWTLRWTCRTEGPGCYRGGETVDRSGRAKFTFVKDNGQWKLREQRGNLLFGDLQPGKGEQ
jgi:hypothetical protein